MTALARSAFKPRTTPMARSGFLTRTPFVRAAAPTTPRLKARQRTPTKSEKLMWTRMAAIGCIACHLDGRFNPVVSIHHIDGRTKPDCHKKVLPLCAGHHQDATDEDKTLVAVHPHKARFERRYGPQMQLLALVHQLLEIPSATPISPDLHQVEFAS
ncbi:MAG: Ref family recombination enhancement nuclease [Pseudomonadota bacterium]